MTLKSIHDMTEGELFKEAQDRYDNPPVGGDNKKAFAQRNLVVLKEIVRRFEYDYEKYSGDRIIDKIVECLIDKQIIKKKDGVPTIQHRNVQTLEAIEAANKLYEIVARGQDLDERFKKEANELDEMIKRAKESVERELGNLNNLELLRSRVGNQREILDHLMEDLLNQRPPVES